ncbi:patatin-like phospholipase family protein [Alkalibacterium thalassium]|uniref:NTE family protein n=1 Tax=Alkalibacterium thalassium TaxID=426701 RepID=A0A1G8X0I0_9LACT|nr:patatin-like phospholipase family protein [Alkalibacterium thalassium]SDJ83837.1 NTE family protein [Alkalibacterium thalassium]
MTPSFFEKKNKKRALVFGGGGERGSFEIGVWRALDELDYVPDIITGTSVGALNGALYILGNVSEAERMWKEIETGKVLDLDAPLSIDSFKDYRRTLTGFLIRIIREKGISSAPLKALIDTYIDDESRIRSDGTIFGLSTTNLKTREIEYYFLDDIEEGRLNDYLLASASLYPAIQKKMIDGTPYIDGGYWNNIPINMALDKLPDQIVLVDLQGPGLLHYDHRIEECESLLIRTKWPLGDMLLFDTNRTEVNIELGYCETMKLARPDIYRGLWYTYDTDTVETDASVFYLALNGLLTGKRSKGVYEYIKRDNHQLIFLREIEKRWGSAVDETTVSLALCELTGKLFNMIPDKIYSIDKFQNEIIHRLIKMRDAERKNPINEFEPRFLLSGKEWTEEFLEGLPLISNRTLVIQIFERLEDEQLKWDTPFYKLMIRTRPFPFIIALYCKYLLNKNLGLYR